MNATKKIYAIAKILGLENVRLRERNKDRLTELVNQAVIDVIENSQFSNDYSIHVFDDKVYLVGKNPELKEKRFNTGIERTICDEFCETLSENGIQYEKKYSSEVSPKSIRIKYCIPDVIEVNLTHRHSMNHGKVFSFERFKEQKVNNELDKISRELLGILERYQ